MAVVESDRGEVPFGVEGMLSAAYVYAGQPEVTADWCRSRVQSGRDTHTSSRIGVVISLAISQSLEESIDATEGLIEAAEATRNPWVLSYALLGFGVADVHSDPVAAFKAARRGQQVAEDSGNRSIGTLLASLLARLEAEYGDSLDALHYISLAIRNHHDSGNPTNLRTPMATLCTVLDRMGRYEPAATIGGFGFNPFAVASQPELGTSIAHLRDVLGNQTYESLARKGETMTTAEMVAYAYDQIDQARAALNAVSK